MELFTSKDLEKILHNELRSTVSREFNINEIPYIYIDRKDCFDKLNSCLIKLPLPIDKKQVDFLMKSIDFLLTEEGEIASDTFDYDKWISSYPKKSL